MSGGGGMSDVSSLVRCQPVHCRYRLTVKSLLGLYSLGLAAFWAKIEWRDWERNSIDFEKVKSSLFFELAKKMNFIWTHNIFILSLNHCSYAATAGLGFTLFFEINCPSVSWHGIVWTFYLNASTSSETQSQSCVDIFTQNIVKLGSKPCPDQL